MFVFDTYFASICMKYQTRGLLPQCGGYFNARKMIFKFILTKNSVEFLYKGYYIGRYLGHQIRCILSILFDCQYLTASLKNSQCPRARNVKPGIRQRMFIKHLWERSVEVRSSSCTLDDSQSTFSMYSFSRAKTSSTCYEPNYVT